ncbi:GNAT family N-acetyltransferase [Paenibacillus sp. WLX1005]|uniref:GNAT family N-acetyltransferase n=1 Tax=Paenibacillus sp. WLX1005 TaxID=3243766 RepID=UPI0039840721
MSVTPIEVHIVPATAEHQEFLWEMLYLSLYAEPGQEPFAREIVHQPGLSKYVEHWGRTGDAGFIALVQEEHSTDMQPIGAVTSRFFTNDNKSYGYVADDIPELSLAIVPGYRGAHIGTSLVFALLDELRRRKYPGVSLSVSPGNPALRLYERFGFREVGVEGTSLTMLLRWDG